MNTTMMKGTITYKYPISDYVRVGAMAFVILLTIVAIKFISLISRNKDKG